MPAAPGAIRTDNRRRLRQLIGELEKLSLETAEQAEGWARTGQPRRHRRRRS